MTARRLRGLALWIVDRAAWLVPGAERRRWRAQWHADVWQRVGVLERTGLVNTRTARGVLGRSAGAVWHAGWLRYRSGGFRMLLHEVRHAFRSLKGRPGFTAVAVLTLALGVGANAVIFSWIEATLLNPIPGIADRGSVAALYFTTPKRKDLSLSNPNFVDLREAKAPGIADIAVFSAGALSLRTDEGAERVWGEIMSGNMFAMLGVTAAQGRVFGPEDDVKPGGHPVVVISDTFWRRRMGERPDAIGSTLTLNGTPFTIIGVTPRGFIGTQPLIALDVFVPLAMQQTFLPGDRLQARGSGWLQGLVRLAPGATMAEAQSGLDVVARRLATEYPEVNGDRGVRLYQLWRQPSGGTSMLLPVMAVLGGLVATLLALVCANMASLLLARTSGRQRELAMRRSLGASRWQVMRLVVVESTVLALGAGVLAAFVSRWSGALLNAFIPPLPLPVAIDAGLSTRVLIFASVVSLVAGIALGLLPGLQASRVDLVTPLKDGAGMGGSATWRRGRVRQGLIVAQVALALVLLVSAGLFTRALDNAQQMDPGFHARQGLVGAIELLPSEYDEARGRAFFERLAEAARAIPGVEAAAVAQRLPLTATDSSDRTVEVEGYTPQRGEEMAVYYASVGQGFFDTIQMPLVAGRDFTPQDTPDTPLKVVVNETMARRYWSGRSSLGGKVKVGASWAEVIGVVKDAKYSTMSEDPRAFMYLTVNQSYRPNMRVVVRTDGPPDAVAGALRQALQQLDPNVPLFDLQTIEQHMAFALFLFQMAAILLSIFGGVAMLLAALGLYGVVAHSVGQRTREIGVRMSLGATSGEVARMVVRQGLTLAVVGIAVGLAAALAVTQLFARQLAGVNPRDPASFAFTALLLAATTAAACYLPARRAARLNPISALRME